MELVKKFKMNYLTSNNKCKHRLCECGLRDSNHCAYCGIKLIKCPHCDFNFEIDPNVNEFNYVMRHFKKEHASILADSVIRCYT